jgi:probable F420-dependent oxidoreductase
MRFALVLPVDRPDPDRTVLNQAALRRMAQAAEQAGFDACSVTDHPAPTRAWLDHGGHLALDPLVALACAGTATTRLRLLTNCYVAPYRHPLLSAKGVATLDSLTDGRVILGLAVGYLEGEFEALDVPFHRRGALLDAAIEQMTRAWTGDDLPGGTVVQPRPATRPHPPLWIGGNSPAALRRAVRAGDGWIPFPAPRRMAEATGTTAMTGIDDLRARIAEARELAEAAGRPRPLDICFTPFTHPHWRETCDPAVFVDEARELAAAGVTWLSFHLPAPSLDAFCDNVASFGEEALAVLRREERDEGEERGEGEEELSPPPPPPPAGGSG